MLISSSRWWDSMAVTEIWDTRISLWELNYLLLNLIIHRLLPTAPTEGIQMYILIKPWNLLIIKIKPIFNLHKIFNKNSSKSNKSKRLFKKIHQPKVISRKNKRKKIKTKYKHRRKKRESNKKHNWKNKKNKKEKNKKKKIDLKLKRLLKKKKKPKNSQKKKQKN